MKRSVVDDVAAVIGRARDVYADDKGASELLVAADRRLHEPPRIALAGMVKAGKSTLLNALIGERVAPTDAGECTRTVTWYRYARTPSIALHLRTGREVRLPVRRDGGNLVLDLGEHTAEEIEWIDVSWPAESLRSTVLIDTPGIGSLSTQVSARSLSFLTPQSSASEADAIIYLLRHVHASDIGFLRAFHDTAAGASQTVNAVAVLSRADEIGSGRIDSLLSAARIAERYRQSGELRSLALGVIPLAGLLAEGARTLRESEFIALRQIAGLRREERDRLLISADRFIRPSADTSLSVDVRARLLERFGIFGVRLSAALIRGGIKTSSELAERLVQQSGLVDLQRFVADQFRARAAALKTRGVVHAVERLLAERPRPGASELRDEIDRIVSMTHDLQELALLSHLRTGSTGLEPDELEEAERIVGGEGLAPLVRVGLPDSADRDQLQGRIGDLVARWRSLASSPFLMRADRERCVAVLRSVEGVASQVSRGGGRVGGSSADVVLAGGPAERPGEQ